MRPAFRKLEEVAEMKIRSLSISIVATILIFASDLSARTWTQAATGRKIDAVFVRLEAAKVVLQYQGKEVVIPLSGLSKEDQDYVANLAAPKSSGGGDWPRFRGPEQSNVSNETGLLQSWPEGGPEKMWALEDVGSGYSSIVIGEGKLFHNGTVEGEMTAFAFDPTTGEKIWESTFGSDDGEGYGGMGSGQRSTPTYADGKLFVLSPLGKLCCLNAEDGKEIWSANYLTDFSGSMGHWGYTESPFVDGNRVIVSPGGPIDSIVALDVNTGEKVWGTNLRDAGTAEYTSIVGAEIKGTKQYVKLFMNLVVGVDAETGKKVWDSDWRGSTAVAATPVVSGDQVFITTGYGVGCKLITVQGRATSDEWDNREMKNHHGGVAKYGDHIYGFSDGPGLMCQSWETGELVWNHKERFTTKGSLCVADGLLFCLNEEGGGVTLAKASSEGFEKRGQFEIEKRSGRNTWAYPVVVGGRLYVRDQNYLVCYDVKGN